MPTPQETTAIKANVANHKSKLLSLSINISAQLITI